MRFATIVLGIALAMTPAAVLACSPVAMTPEQRDAAEDRQLLESTILFRGVVENFRPDEYGEPVMDIRHTHTFWGRGAPARIRIPTEYFSMCARGNLHPAVQFEGRYSEFPVVRDGLGVTVLGRREDFDAPWNLIVLVDRFPDTQRVLSRFEDLKRGQ